MGDPRVNMPGCALCHCFDVLAAALASRQHKIATLGIGLDEHVPQTFGRGLSGAADVAEISEFASQVLFRTFALHHHVHGFRHPDFDRLSRGGTQHKQG